MKRMLILTAVALATLSGCGAYRQSNQALWRDAPDYASMKAAAPAPKAYAYGNGTILEFAEGTDPAWIRIRSSSGAAIPFDQHGRFIRIPERLERFTAWINGVPREFVVAGGAVPLVPLTPSAPAKPAEAVQVDRISSHTAKDLRAELDVLKANVDQLAKQPGAVAADWKPVTQRLDALEARVAESIAATVAVQFAYGETAFKPSPAARRLIAAAVARAEAINIKGFTDARVAGPADPRIAHSRAQGAKDYLLAEGVSAAKITVASRPNGGFVADNNTVSGRAKNRRVEIEFVQPKRGLAERTAG